MSNTEGLSSVSFCYLTKMNQSIPAHVSQSIPEVVPHMSPFFLVLHLLQVLWCPEGRHKCEMNSSVSHSHHVRVDGVKLHI